MGVLVWCAAAVPVVLFIVRKCREYTWGTCQVTASLKDKCFIVTGANSGLGKETVKELVARRARVIMACRDLAKANLAIRDIRLQIKTGELIPMELDLSSVKSVHQFASDVLKDFPKIHVLINNAGVSIPHRLGLKTKDNFEINFGSNHLGHFLLTQLLLERLKESAPSRIVIVSSTLHQKGIIEFENLQGEKGFDSDKRNLAYCNSKLANIYFCRELSKRLPKEVQVFAVCPGLCYTNLMRYSEIKWYQYLLIAPLVPIFLRTAKQGCQTILHCALSEEVIGLSGEMFRDCKPYKSKFQFDETVQKELWTISQRLVDNVPV